MNLISHKCISVSLLTLFKPVDVIQQVCYHTQAYLDLFIVSYVIQAINMDGDLFCWGSNDHYQLGIGTMVQSPGIDRGQTMSILVPSVNPKVRNVVVVACGWQHTIAIADPINLTDNLTTHHESKAFCWGDNKFGQLGILSDSAIVHCPTQINLSSLTQPYRVRSVSCGWKHSLLATATGEV